MSEAAATLILEVNTRSAEQKLNDLDAKLKGLGQDTGNDKAPKNIQNVGKAAEDSTKSVEKLREEMRKEFEIKLSAKTGQLDAEIKTLKDNLAVALAKAGKEGGDAFGKAIKVSLKANGGGISLSSVIDADTKAQLAADGKAIGLEIGAKLAAGLTDSVQNSVKTINRDLEANTRASLTRVVRMHKEAQDELKSNPAIARATYAPELLDGTAVASARAQLRVLNDLNLEVKKFKTDFTTFLKDTQLDSAAQKYTAFGKKVYAAGEAVKRFGADVTAAALGDGNRYLLNHINNLDRFVVKQRAANSAVSEGARVAKELAAAQKVFDNFQLASPKAQQTIIQKVQYASTLPADQATKSFGAGIVGLVPRLGEMQEVSAALTSANNSIATSAGKAGTAIHAQAKYIKGFANEAWLAHSAARGLAGGFGALWLTYGSTIPLMTGAALSTGFVQATKSGAEFAYQLEFVKALGGETAATMARVGEATLGLAKGGMFAPVELANGLRILSQAGLNANEALSTLPATMQLAVVGEMQMEEAALTLTGVMNAFSLGVKDMSYIGDVFAKSAAVSQTSVVGMTNAMKTASVVGEQYGASIEDTATALAVLAKVNITGTAAGTSMRNMLKELYTPVPAAAAAIKKLGLETADAMGNMRPFPDIIYDLKTKLQDFDKVSQTQILQRIFGERGAKEAISMLSMTRQEWEKLKASIAESDGFMSKVSQQLEATTKGQFVQAFNTLKASMVEAFNASEGAAYQLATALKDLAGSPVVVEGLKVIINLVATLGSALVNATPYLLGFGAAYAALKVGGAVIAGFTALSAAIPLVTAAMSASTAAAVAGTSVLSSLRAGLLATGSAAGVAAGAANLGGLAAVVGSLSLPATAVAAAISAMGYAIYKLAIETPDSVVKAQQFTAALGAQLTKLEETNAELRKRNALMGEGKKETPLAPIETALDKARSEIAAGAAAPWTDPATILKGLQASRDKIKLEKEYVQAVGDSAKIEKATREQSYLELEGYLQKAAERIQDFKGKSGTDSAMAGPAEALVNSWKGARPETEAQLRHMTKAVDSALAEMEASSFKRGTQTAKNIIGGDRSGGFDRTLSNQYKEQTAALENELKAQVEVVKANVAARRITELAGNSQIYDINQASFAKLEALYTSAAKSKDANVASQAKQDLERLKANRAQVESVYTASWQKINDERVKLEGDLAKFINPEQKGASANAAQLEFFAKYNALYEQAEISARSLNEQEREWGEQTKANIELGYTRTKVLAEQDEIQKSIASRVSDLQVEIDTIRQDAENGGLIDGLFADNAIQNLLSTHLPELKLQLEELRQKAADVSLTNLERSAANVAANKLERSFIKMESESNKTWRKMGDDLERALTDSLMRSFESGESFGKSFLNSLKNMFKTTVLKLTVDATVNFGKQLLGNALDWITGGSGGGGLGSALGLVSNASTAYGLYGAYNTYAGLTAAGVGGGQAALSSAYGMVSKTGAAGASQFSVGYSGATLAEGLHGPTTIGFDGSTGIGAWFGKTFGKTSMQQAGQTFGAAAGQEMLKVGGNEIVNIGGQEIANIAAQEATSTTLANTTSLWSQAVNVAGSALTAYGVGSAVGQKYGHTAGTVAGTAAAAGSIYAGGAITSIASTGGLAGAGTAGMSALSAIPGWGWAAMAVLALVGSLSGGDKYKQAILNTQGTWDGKDFNMGTTFAKRVDQSALAPMDALLTAYSERVTGLLKLFDVSTDGMQLGTGMRHRRNNDETQTTFGVSFNESEVGKDAYLWQNKMDKSYTTHGNPMQAFEQYATDVLGKGLKLAINASSIQDSIKKLFEGVDDNTGVETVVAAVVNMNEALKGEGASLVNFIGSMNFDAYRKEGERNIDIVSRMTATVLGANVGFEKLGLALFDLTASGFDAYTTLEGAFGGMEGLQTTLASYYENFYTEEEKRANVIKDIGDQLRAAGAEITDETIGKATREQFREAYEAIVETSGAASPLAIAMLKVQGAFAGVVPAAEGLSKTLTESLDADFNALKASVQAEKDAAQERYDAQLEGLNLQLEAAQTYASELDSIASSIKSSLDSVDEYKYYSQTADQYSGAFAGYAAQQGELYDYLADLSSQAGTQAEAAEQAAKTIETAIEQLGKDLEADLKDLDDIVTKAQEQINAINNVNTSVLSVEAAVAKLDATIASALTKTQAATTTTATTTTATTTTTGTGTSPTTVDRDGYTLYYATSLDQIPEEYKNSASESGLDEEAYAALQQQIGGADGLSGLVASFNAFNAQFFPGRVVSLDQVMATTAGAWAQGLIDAQNLGQAVYDAAIALTPMVEAMIAEKAAIDAMPDYFYAVPDQAPAPTEAPTAAPTPEPTPVPTQAPNAAPQPVDKTQALIASLGAQAGQMFASLTQQKWQLTEDTKAMRDNVIAGLDKVFADLKTAGVTSGNPAYDTAEDNITLQREVWALEDAKALKSIMDGVADSLFDLSATDTERQVKSITEAYTEQVKAAKTLGATLKDVQAITELSIASLNSLSTNLSESIATSLDEFTLSDTERQVKSLQTTRDQQIADAKAIQAGALEQEKQARINLAAARQGGASQDVLDGLLATVVNARDVFNSASTAIAGATSLYEASIGKLLEDLMEPVRDQLADLKSTELERTLNGINKAYDEQVKAAKTLGATLEELNQIAELRNIQTANANVDAAFATFQRSIDAEKKRITEDAQTRTQALRDSIEANQDALSTAGENLSKLESIFDTIEDGVKRLRNVADPKQTMLQARSYIDMALMLAQAGTMPDQDKLSDAIGVITSDTSEMYASLDEFGFAQLVQAGKLQAIGDIAGDQKTIAQQQLDSLEDANKYAEEQIEAIEKSAQDQIDALDRMAEQYKEQIDTLRGIDTSIVSLATAVSSLNSAISGLAGAMNKPSPIPYAPDLHTTKPPPYSTTTTITATMPAVTPTKIVDTGMFKPTTTITAKFPGYAVGTSYVPEDMTANIHKGEIIIDPASSNILRKYGIGVQGGSDPALAAELKALRETNARLEARLAAIEKNTRETRDLTYRVTEGGNVMRTVAA